MRTGSLLTIFGVLLIGAALFLDSFAGSLPERVASHFDASGNANSYMTRDGYRMFMLIFTIGVPIFVVIVAGLLPRMLMSKLPVNKINMPNRAYWLAPERRAETIDFMSGFGIKLGCLMVLFLCAINWLVVSTNSSSNHQLPLFPFLTIVGVFLASIIGLVVSMYRRFGKKAMTK